MLRRSAYRVHIMVSVTAGGQLQLHIGLESIDVFEYLWFEFKLNID